MTLVTNNARLFCRSNSRRVLRNADAERACGFTLIELLVVVVIAMLVTAMAMPLARNTIRSYRLSAAGSAVAGAIQTTRYQAIMVGCPYTLTFTTTTNTYQAATQSITGTPPACATTYSNVGPLIPWATSSEISMSPAVVLTFNPNGTVSSNIANTPPMVLTLAVGGMSKTVTISGVGNVKVK